MRPGRLETLTAKTMLFVTALALAQIGVATAQDAELAQKLTNPVADLVSLPFQINHDRGFGADGDGWRTTLNIQPVYPIRLTEDWNLISRTIAPVIWQDGIAPGGRQAGLGDVLQSLFLSPVTSGDGLIWGVGPAFGVPTATDDALGAGKWTVGPTGAALRMDGPFTYGALANHLWSFAGEADRTEVNQSFVQPFIAYTTPAAVTVTASSETVYDWRGEAWAVPLNLTVSRLLDADGRPVSVQAGLRYWVDSPDGGPEGVGFRIGATLLFPR